MTTSWFRVAGTSRRHGPAVLAWWALLALAVGGVVHGLRASAAQVLYYQSRHRPGLAARTPEEVDRVCRRAERLYPHQYYFAGFAGEWAYLNRFGENDTLQPERLRLARHWADRALAGNPYRARFQQLHANLLAERSPEEAVHVWSRYVNWDFWNPFHHAFLAELLVKAGAHAEALRSVAFIEGTPPYAETRALVLRSWAAEVVSSADGWTVAAAAAESGAVGSSTNAGAVSPW